MTQKSLNQNKLPIYDALQNYRVEQTTSFHVPGHKQGQGNLEMAKLLGNSCLKLDLACMEDLDFLSRPEGVIKEAETLAAKLYGAENAYFLVNGTTSGIQAMIMSVCQPGDKIIIPRNMHKSVISGLILSGAQPVYLEPEINTFWGIAMGVKPETVLKTLKEHPEAKGVFLINPTYYGAASELETIIKLVHTFGKPVLIDEAHGAHLKFDSRLPICGITAGADLVASSTHKLGGSLTQSSLLLQQGKLVDPAKLRTMLNLIQTTSPSYLLLVSLDIARKQLALQGEKLVNKMYTLVQQARKAIREIDGLVLLGEEIIGEPGCFAFDPTKIVVNVRELGLSGYEFAQILRKNYQIQVELADLFNILALVSIGDTPETLNKLVRGLKDLAKSRPLKKMVKYALPLPRLPEMVLTPREAFFAQGKSLSLEEAIGEISSEMIMAYPPGIPLICPGEKITQEIVDYLNLFTREKIKLQGMLNPARRQIKVVAETGSKTIRDSHWQAI